MESHTLLEEICEEAAEEALDHLAINLDCDTFNYDVTLASVKDYIYNLLKVQDPTVLSTQTILNTNDATFQPGRISIIGEADCTF